MDGSYGNVFPNGSPMSPMTPSSSGGDAYKVNVTRKKTKKWAEFKPQNYDGDDWGTDYDDGHEEAPPMPKPMGPRQPVQPPPHLRQFQPSGVPPLQTTSQQPVRPTETGSPFTSAPQTTGNAPGRMNPDSAAPGSSIYSSGPGFPQQGGSGSGSGTPLRRLSPAPPSAGPQSIPSRFPPRKSSMGQSDAPDTAELMRQSRSNDSNYNNPRPGSSHKPWVEPRSASPANSAKSPVSPGKPLPFIRPADIYRRIPEEKEKERRSMESSRPSMDSITSRGLGLERVDSAPKAAPSPTPEDKRQTSGAGSALGSEQETEIRRGSRPSLAPVAERKSEYGLDGLLDSYGFTSDPPKVEPAPTTTAAAAQGDSQSQTQNAASAESGPALPSAPSLSWHTHTQTATPASAPAPAPAPSLTNQSQYQQPLDEQEQPQPAVTSQDDVRRFSTSPKLPDLGRMSAFGDDLFSTTSRYSTVFPTNAPSTASHLPVVQDSPPPSTSEQVPPPAASMAPPRTSSDDKVPTIGNDGDQQPSSTNPQPTDSSVLGSVQTTSTTVPSASVVSDQPSPSTTPPPESSSATIEKQIRPLRPSLPGAWVSETPTTAEDLATPTPYAPSLAVIENPESPSDASPKTEPDNSAREAVSQTTSQLPVEDTTKSNPQPLASPHILPPLRTGSPALSLSPRASTEIPQPEKQDASTTRDITPTAPLNPSRAPREETTPEDSIMGQNNTIPYSDGSTLDTSGGSPLKESDKLREEIIKSLSPVQGSSSLPETVGQSTAAYHQAAGPMRESSYLSGVYDDYWGAGEDNLKSELQLDETLTQKEQVPEKRDRARNQAKAETFPPAPLHAAPTPAAAANAPQEIVPSPQQQTVTTSSARPLRQRFSWEAEPEVIKSPDSAPEPKSLGSEHQTVVGATVAPPSVPSVLTPTVDASHLSPAAPKSDLLPAAEVAQAGGISHQVSGASTIPPRSTLDAPIDPPSPISVLSERVGPDAKSRRLSLAEEKAGAHTSSHPVSPTPPLDEHPALAGGASAFPAPAPASAPAPVRRDPASLVLFPFRQTMGLPLVEDRIKTFAETRAEYASMNTGLDEWLTMMMKEHPEYANATSSFRPTTAHQPSAQNSGQAYPTGDLTEGGLPPNARPLPHHIHGHAHNQVGTKSKELLMAAGKAGKGLFSKGKNKLRGTGDKDFEPQAALAAAPIRQSWAPTAAARAPALGLAGPAGAVNQQFGRFGAGETPLDVQAPLTRPSQSASTPTTPLLKPKSTPKKGDRRTSWAFSLGFRSSRSDLAARPASVAAPNLTSRASASASASSVSLSLFGSGSAQQATRIRPLSTQALQAAQPQLLATSARSNYQGPRPQFGPSAPPPQPPLNSSEKSWGASSPPLSSTSFHPSSQLPFARNNSSSQGGRPSSAPLPPPPRTSTPVNQGPRGKNNSIDRSVVLSLDNSSPSRPRRDSQVEVELVSPVSDTFSNRPTTTPAPYERELSDSLRIPAPISKVQPSWDPFTGTPLVEEDDFNFEGPAATASSTARVPSPVAAVTANNGARTTSAQAAHVAPSDLSSTKRPDDISRGSNVIVVEKFNLTDKDVADGDKDQAQQHQQQLNIQRQDIDGPGDEMAAYAQNSNLPTLPPSANNYSQHPYNPHNAYLQHQQQPQSQGDPNAPPQRQTSFVGLPPIPREPGLGESLLNFPSDEGNGDNGSSQQQRQQQPSPHQHQQQQPVQPLGAAQAQFVSMSPGQPQLVHNVYRPTQPQHQGFPTPPPGVSNQQWTLRPQGPVPGGQGGQQRSFSGPPANAPPSMLLNGGAQQINMGGQGGPQAAPRPVMMPPPHMQAQMRGFQPQGGWTVQESHLTEPLHSPNRHRSSSNASTHQPVYGFDKETGVSSSGPSGRDADEDTMTNPPLGPPAATAAQTQEQASQPQPPPSQVSPASPPGPNAAAPGLPSPEPDQSDLVPPGPIPAAADEARARRSSGVFSGFGGLKERLTGLSADERPGSATGPRFQGATGDAVSDASVATDNGPKKRGLFGLRSSGTGFDSQPPRSKESMIAHGPGTPSNDERDQPGPSPYPQPEKKRTGFLGFGGASGSAPPSKLVNSHTPRPSVSSTTPSEIPQTAGSAGGPPKKRFSALTSKFHKAGHGVQEGLKPPGTAQSSHPTLQGQSQPPQSSPGQQHQQPVQANGGPAATMDGRERSESNATTRPLTAQQTGSSSNANPNPMHQKPTTPNPEAKKGGFFGRLMHKEAKPAPSPAPVPAPGQPILNPMQTNPAQGQMGRGQQPFPQGPGGPPPQFFGAPGQPPLPQQGPIYLQVQGPDGKIVTQPFIQVQTPDGRIMLQPVQIVQRPGPPGQPPQMMMIPLPMMNTGQPQVNAPQGALQPNGQPGGSAQGLPGQPSQLPPQQVHNQPPPHMQAPTQTPVQAPAQAQSLGQQQMGSPGGLQQPPTPQQQAQSSLPGPGRERGNSVASPPSGAGSPQIGSSVSPQTQNLASPPADASRSQNASPVSFRQPIPVPPPGSIQGTPPQALRQPASSPTPPIAQSFARKPVSSSPKPSSEQFHPPPAPGSHAGPLSDRAAALAAQIQPSPLGPQGSPAPPSGTSTEQQARLSHSPIPQPPPGTPSHFLQQRLPPQQSSPGGTQAVNRIPQPVPVPLPTPTPQPVAQHQQNKLLQPPNQPSPPVSASSPQQGDSASVQGPPGSEVSRVPSHGSAVSPAPSQSAQANQQAQSNMGSLGPIKEQSTFSKILKGALPTEPVIGQEKPGKEKSKSSFFSALRGRSKQSEGQSQPQPQPQQVQAQPGQPAQQGAPQGQLGQGRPSMSPLQSNPTGVQGQGQPGPQAQYQQQRQSPGGSASPDGNQAAQQPGPQPTPVANQGPTQQQQPTQAQQGPTGLRQPGQQMPPPAMGRGGPQGPPPSQNQNRGPAEPQQYPQVPIPQGYRPVHAEGNVGAPPAPYYVGAPGGIPGQPPFRSMPGQFGPPGMQQQQPWLQQNAMARQIQPVPLPGQGQQHPMYRPGPGPVMQGAPQGQNLPPGAQCQPVGPPGSVLLPQQRQQQPQPQPQQGPPQPIPQQFSQAQNSLPSADNSPHPSGPTPIATPGGLSPVSASPPPTVLNAAPPAQNQFQPRPIPAAGPGLVTTVTGPPPGGQPQPAMSPQNYPLPNSAFSPVNPAAAGMPHPPLPLGSHPAPYPQSQFLNHGGAVPQRQVSAVSAISMQPDNHPQNTISPGSHALPGQQPQNGTPSPQITPDRTVSPEPQVPTGGGGVSHPSHLVIDSRTVSPEPPNQSLAPPPVTTPRSNKGFEEDNLYDATPRQSLLPQSRQVQNSIAENVETSSPGQYNEVAKPPVVLAPPPLQVHHQQQQQQQQQQHQQQYEQQAHQQQNQQRYEQQPPQQHNIIVQPPQLQPQPQQPQEHPQAQIQAQPDSQPQTESQAPPPPRERELPPPQPVSEPSSPAPLKADLAENNTNGDGPSQEERPPPVTHINGKPITSSADIFNEEKRKMLIREQEEKIPVFPEEPDMNLAALAAAKKKEQEELPQMSATSYPGQEWNPYGDGGFEDSDGEQH